MCPLIVSKCRLAAFNFTKKTIMLQRYFYRALILIILTNISVLQNRLAAQTTLVAGDIAFTGYISSNATDEFSFVLLKNVVTNTSINFTDNGWTGTAFRPGEGTITWVSNANYNAGTEIKIAGSTATLAGAGGSAGTVNVATALSLSTSGDQIFAYQGNAATPTFISGIHMNYWTTAAGDPANTNAANWDGQSTSNVSSALPSTLTTGTNAVWIYTAAAQHPTEKTNARFNCSGSLNTLANLRASIYTFSNWTGDANTATASFTLPTNCNYLGVLLPIRLLGFNAVQKDHLTEINWKTNEEINLGRYEVERSFNGRDFTIAATLLPQAITGGIKNYTVVDNTIFLANEPVVYYRLKSVDLDGSYSYSYIVRLLLKQNNTRFSIYPNPSTNYAVIYAAQKATAVITDVAGRTVKRFSLTQGSNLLDVSGFSPGTYLIAVSGMPDVIKWIKQ